MSMEETKEIKTKKKRKISKSALIIIAGILIIAIPVIVFVSILGISALQTGSPRDGSRFEGDLVNEITSDDISSIETDLKSLSNIESVEVKLSEGQLKVYIDTTDSLTENEVDDIVNKAYEKVTTKLPINTYFTRTNSAKMYDLQINVYTTSENVENRQYKFLHKNSAEDKYAIDDLAHPKDPELVNDLLGNGDAEEEAEEQVEE